MQIVDRVVWFALAALLMRVAPPAAAADAESPAPADLIVRNAKVTTVDDARPQAEALASRGETFVAVGSEVEVMKLRGKDTRVIDAGGRRVIPGLNDSHLHVVRGGRFFHLELRWDGVGSLARGLEMIREQAKRTPKGQWVRVVGGWSPYQFKERRLPTVRELNEAAPETPVFVLFLYSQGLLNAAGVEALGLGPNTPAPPGGRYEFVEGGGAVLHADPSPVILYTTIDMLPKLSAEDQLNSTKHFYRELGRFGLTSALDAGGGGHAYPADYQSTATLAAQPDFPLRISFFLFAQKPGAELASYRTWTAEETLDLNRAADRLGGYVLEGAGENLVASAGDYENFLSPRPDLKAEMETDLTAVANLLAEHQWPIRIHATYDESITRMLDVFERVFPAASYRSRWLIDHAETISGKNVARIKALGGAVAVQDRMAFAGEYFVERYGQAAAASAPPLRRLLDAGIPVGAGTDGTRVSSYNPWLSLYWLSTGKTLGGLQLSAAENRLSRQEALRLYTVGSARLSGDEGVKGRIGPGQYADFAILSADYLSVPDEEIRSIESLLTVTGGDVAYAAAPFADLAPAPLPPVSPSWSPVALFGGYQRGG